MKNARAIRIGLPILTTAVALGATGLPALASGGGGGTVEVTVVIENLAPEGGTYLTPVWVGFHDGSFDLYDHGAPASMELERLAEDGNTGPLADLFDASGTGSAQATIVSDSGIPPLAPGETATMTFTLNRWDPKSRYLSYGAMVLPSNDAFVANSRSRAIRIFSRGGWFRGADFIVRGSWVNDAGTELNDEDPMNTAFFGQATPDTGLDEGVVVHDHVGFKLPGNGGILDDPMFADADFLSCNYPMARITVLLD